MAGGPAPTDQVVIPTQYVPGSTSNNIAVVKFPANTFNLADPEIKIANFPTSSPLFKDPLYAVAYGNQAPDQATLPVLKYAKLNLAKPSVCQDFLANTSLPA
jgi:hypothetical protein